MLSGWGGIARKEEATKTRCNGRAGTTGVHANSHDRPTIIHGDAKSPVIARDPWPIDACDIPRPLDRTQEVAVESG
jgi:hypothetical protein